MKLSTAVKQFLITFLLCATTLGFMEAFSLKEKWNLGAWSYFIVFLFINFISVLLANFFEKRVNKKSPKP
jgi:FtsH-binding integral membrane protein